MAARFFHRFRPRVVLVALAVILVNPLSLNAARNLAGFDIFASTGASMEPTYSGHEFGIGLPAWSGRPGRGDIVSFASPRGDGETFMKRVVGLPGETIGVTSSGILVDGELLDEPYIRAGTERHPATWSLGPDEYFVMGDNRGYSLDSRSFGPVRAEELARLGVVAPLGVADAWAVTLFAAATTVVLGTSGAFAVAAGRRRRAWGAKAAFASLAFLTWTPALVAASFSFRRSAVPDREPGEGSRRPPVPLARVLPTAAFLVVFAVIYFATGERLLSIFGAVATTTLPQAARLLLPDRAAHDAEILAGGGRAFAFRYACAHLFWLGVVVAFLPASALVHATFLGLSLVVLIDDAKRDHEIAAFARLASPFAAIGATTLLVLGPASGESGAAAIGGLIVAAIALLQVRRYRPPVAGAPASAVDL